MSGICLPWMGAAPANLQPGPYACHGHGLVALARNLRFDHAPLDFFAQTRSLFFHFINDSCKRMLCAAMVDKAQLAALRGDIAALVREAGGCARARRWDSGPTRRLRAMNKIGCSGQRLKFNVAVAEIANLCWLRMLTGYYIPARESKPVSGWPAARRGEEWRAGVAERNGNQRNSNANQRKVPHHALGQEKSGKRPNQGNQGKPLRQLGFRIGAARWSQSSSASFCYLFI